MTQIKYASQQYIYASGTKVEKMCITINATSMNNIKMHVT